MVICIRVTIAVRCVMYMLWLSAMICIRSVVWTEWTTFRNDIFWIMFLKSCVLWWTSCINICSYLSNGQWVIIVSGNGFTLDNWRVIRWTNVDAVHWRMYHIHLKMALYVINISNAFRPCDACILHYIELFHMKTVILLVFRYQAFCKAILGSLIWKSFLI